MYYLLSKSIPDASNVFSTYMIYLILIISTLWGDIK